jgi:hypothetical protein
LAHKERDNNIYLYNNQERKGRNSKAEKEIKINREVTTENTEKA